MKSSSYLLRILNVRPNEWKLVKRLFIFEFFQGAGIAFFFTAAFAMFLDRFHINELPWVMIYSAFLLWLAGYVYSRMEAKLRITSVARYLTYFMAGSFLVFRLGVEIFPPWFLYLMLAWYNVLYLLNNLEFWGMSSLLFDVRQSKRLFGLISAGDIPAKFIGYSVALVLVSYLGTANLIWVGFACMLASLPSLLNIERSESHINLHHKHHHHDNNHLKQTAHPVTRLFQNFTANVLIRRIAIITIIASAVFMIVNYSFYAKVKESGRSDVQLAQFIAFFFAFVRIMALIVKMIFTGRLINRLGIIKSLLITPVLTIVLVVLVILMDQSVLKQSGTIYLFGAMAIVVEILRTSINTPVFLTLMQPLGTHERLRAHTITKGIMDPFASLATGILLLVVIRFDKNINLPSLDYILLFLGIAWIIGVYRIHEQYLKTLLKTIASRFFHNEEFSVTDPTALDWLKEKLSSGTQIEALNILKMLSQRHDRTINDIIISALDHPSDLVKTKAIQLASERNIQHSEEKLREIMHNSPDPELKSEAIKALCKINIDEKEVLPFIENNNRLVQQVAITGLLKFGDEQSRAITRNYFSSMIHSGDTLNRKTATLVLQELKDPHYRQEIDILLYDENPGVVHEAFLAAGKTGDEGLLKTVIRRLNTQEKAVLESLHIAGVHALPVIDAFLHSGTCTHRQTEKLIRLTGRIGGDRAHHHLLNYLDKMPEYYHLIIKTLYLSNYKVGITHHHLFESQLRSYLSYCASILYMQKLLVTHDHKYQVLINSLELELNNLRDSLLYIFALMYDREKIKDVRSAFRSGRKEAIANAMEIIDMTVKKETANYFNIIFEKMDLDHKIRSLKKLYLNGFFTTVEMVLSTILQQEVHRYGNWTKACTLYTVKKQQVHVMPDLIAKYIGSENPLLSQVAKYAIYEIKTL